MAIQVTTTLHVDFMLVEVEVGNSTCITHLLFCNPSNNFNINRRAAECPTVCKYMYV